MNYEQHMHWCRERALNYLPDDPLAAFESMASDLLKHEETTKHLRLMVVTSQVMLIEGPLAPDKMREFILSIN